MSAPPPIVPKSPPALGSFPLDTQGICSEFARKYLNCVKLHDTHASPCRELAQMYLKCRMKHGLMEVSSMQDLGFGSQHTDNGT